MAMCTNQWQHFISLHLIGTEGGKPQFGFIVFCANYLHLRHKSMLSMFKPIVWLHDFASNRYATVTKAQAAQICCNLFNLIFVCLIISVCRLFNFYL